MGILGVFRNFNGIKIPGMKVTENDLSPPISKDFIDEVRNEETTLKTPKIKLSPNEAKVKALLEAIPDMMFIQNSKGDFLDFYAPNSKKLLVIPDQIIGKNMVDILPPSIYKKFKVALEKTMLNKKIHLLEYTLERDDKLEYYEARIVPLNEKNTLTIVRDITEKKISEQQINIINRALAAVGNGIIILDALKPDLPIIYCNQAFEMITGYKKKDVYGLNISFLYGNDTEQKGIKAIKKAFKKVRPCKTVLRNYRKDGTLFWNQLTITPVHNEEMELTHYIGVQNDITDQKREEYFKDQIRNILEDITKKVSLVNIANSVTETAEIYLENCMASILLLDKKKNTLHILSAPNLPKAYSDRIEGIAIDSDFCSCSSAAFSKCKKIVSDIETDEIWKSHKDIALEYGLKSCWSYPILSSNKEILGVFTIYSKHQRYPTKNEKNIILDMTYLSSVAIEQHSNTISLKENERKLERYTQQLEEKVQERTQEVMAIVQKLVETNLNLEDQIQITKTAEAKAIAEKALATEIAKNFPKGVIAVINDKFEVLLAEGEALDQIGLKDQISDGTSLNEISMFSDNRKKRIKNHVSRTIAGEHLNFEMSFKNVYFTVNTAPLYDENMNASSALIVYSNITEQKKIEIEIQRALKKEQELNELKSRFISMASHEFRTPLSVILTSATLIDHKNKLGKHVEGEKYLKKITNNVNNLELILNDFLSLTKLDEGKITTSLKSFDLIEFTEALVEEIGIHKKNGQTITIINHNPEVLVYLDPKLMRHIIINLLSNATKYSPVNTEITLRVTHDQDKVWVEIDDKGIGIPEDEQKNLFQRFFRARNAANIEGTGIGLNIVKRYVELLNGKVSFKSEVNVGTTFIIELPKNDINIIS